MESIPSLDALKAALFDLSQPIGKRTRAIFYLRTRGTQEDLHVLLKALKNKNDSELMRHELAYVIGQFQDTMACSTLERVLQDENDECMVRHEAAEALGAIGHPNSIPVLEKYVNHTVNEISETCQLAIQLIHYKQKHTNPNSDLDDNPYKSIDPAPAFEKNIFTQELKDILLNHRQSLFDRYRAMFSLRNRNTKEAALALAEAFADESALFRHEIAYVMGQMENPSTIPALRAVLFNVHEHRMVRHEAAEALGSIGTDECKALLLQYNDDPDTVVRESCHVALDMIEYWKE